VAPYWRAVIDANRDRLAVPGDPDLILPGQVIVLPG
jgi:nucleoid-associated protein YgaU